MKLSQPFFERKNQQGSSGLSLCPVRCDISCTWAIEGDKSRKGSVDAAIVDLIEEMNQHPLLYTTSSCSGRVSLFEEDLMGHVGKKGGQWIYVSHQEPEWDELHKAMQRWQEGDGTKTEGKGRRWNFRFEPFIVACECGTLETARMLVQIGREAGFRESGIVLGKDRIQATVRSATRTEIPVCEQGIMLIAESSWDVLLRIVSEKFRKNGEKIDAFRHLFRTTFASQTPASMKEMPHDMYRRPAFEDRSLQWQPLTPREASVCPSAWHIEMADGLLSKGLERWGHSVCVINHAMLIFGGYGGKRGHQRLNDMLLYHPATNTLTEHTVTGDIPSPRMGHVSVAMGNTHVLGGV